MNMHLNRKKKRLPTPKEGSLISLTINYGAPKYKRDKYLDCDLSVPWVVYSVSRLYFTVRHPNHGSKDYMRPDGTIEPNEKSIKLSRYGNSQYSGVFWDIVQANGWHSAYDTPERKREVPQPKIPEEPPRE